MTSFKFKLLALLLVILLGVALSKQQELTQLYHSTQLFKPDVIVHNFSNISAIIPTTKINKSGPVAKFGNSPQALPTEFDYFGSMVNTQQWLEQSNTTSLVVVKDNDITFEQYFQNTTEFDQRISWSMAKSFLSALVGIAVEEGDIPDLNALVIDYVPELLGTGYENATIKNVLEMSSGVYFDEDYADFFSDINRFGRVLALGGSFDEFAASLTSEIEPGKRMHYVSIDTHVIGMVLRAATGKEIVDYFDSKLWSKLGAEQDAAYIVDSENQPMVLGGLNLISRDYARFGVMYRDFGFYNGQQIIPKQWTITSTRANEEYLQPRKVGEQIHFGYGFQWWIPYNADQEFFAIGIYGQFIYINRKLGVVIVKHSGDTKFLDNNKESRVKAIEAFRAIAKSVN